MHTAVLIRIIVSAHNNYFYHYCQCTQQSCFLLLSVHTTIVFPIIVSAHNNYVSHYCQCTQQSCFLLLSVHTTIMFPIIVSAHNNYVSHYCQCTQQLIPTTELTNYVFLATHCACCGLRTETIYYLHKFCFSKNRTVSEKNQPCFVFHTDTHKLANCKLD